MELHFIHIMSQMLIFDSEYYCRLTDRFSLTGPQPAGLGGWGLNLFLVEEGAAAVDDVARLLPAGGMAVAAGPLHFAPVGTGRVVGVCLAGAAAGEIQAGLDGPRLFVPGSTVDHGEAAGAASALRRLADPAFAGAARQSALGYELLCRLAYLPAGEEAAPPLVAAAIELIRAHYAEVYGVEELAGELEVSKGHLIRSFSAATGLSPGRYLTTVRLEAAKALLIHRDYPLEVVAGLCGFSGAGYLCRVFKREEGMTPSAWRSANMPQVAGLPEEPPSEWEESIYL